MSVAECFRNRTGIRIINYKGKLLKINPSKHKIASKFEIAKMTPRIYCNFARITNFLTKKIIKTIVIDK